MTEAEAEATRTAVLQRAVLLAASAEGVLSLMDAIIKTLSGRYPILQIAFLRFVMGSLFAVVLFAVRSPGWPTPEAVRYNATRSVLAAFSAVTFFFGLSKLPLAEAMALSFLAPLFIAVLGVVVLKERFHPRVGLALAAGLVGMAVIVGGRFGAAAYAEDAVLGALSVLASTITYAFVVILLRARANTDPLPVIVLFQNVGPGVLLAVPGVLVWQTLPLRDVPLFLLIGLLGVTGHTLLARAFARAEAARLAPVHYLVLAWGTFYGWVLFGDLPGVATLIGASIVVGATWLARRV